LQTACCCSTNASDLSEEHSAHKRSISNEEELIAFLLKLLNGQLFSRSIGYTVNFVAEKNVNSVSGYNVNSVTSPTLDVNSVAVFENVDEYETHLYKSGTPQSGAAENLLEIIRQQLFGELNWNAEGQTNVAPAVVTATSTSGNDKPVHWFNGKSTEKGTYNGQDRKSFGWTTNVVILPTNLEDLLHLLLKGVLN